MFSKLQSEIKAWRDEVQNKCLEGYLACFQHDTSTYIVTQAHPDYQPLREALRQGSWTLEDKISLLRKIAKTMNYSLNMKLPLVHGHLHPGNVLVNKATGGMVITDLGLHFLKKYIGMLTNGYPEEYTNKQAYCSPDILLTKGKVVHKCCEKDDVYSFGLMVV
jgi:serine/threonine protein kinase